MTSSQVVDEIMRSFKDDDVATWAKVLWETDYPKDYFITFAAIISTILFILLPATVAHFIMTTLVSYVLPDKEFMLDLYLP